MDVGGGRPVAFGMNWRQLIVGMIVSFFGLIIGSHIIVRFGGKAYSR